MAVADAAAALAAAGCSRLRRLQLRRTAVTDTGLLQLAHCCGLRLQHLCISACDSLSDAGVSAVVLYCTELQHIDLCGDPMVTDIALCAMACHFPQLLHLDVHGCTAHTDVGLIAAANGCSTLMCRSVHSQILASPLLPTAAPRCSS